MDNQKYTYLLEQFGKRLKQLRKEKGKTQLDIEVATGINNGDISRIENGKTNIEFITIAKLSEALEVEISDLFKFETLLEVKKKRLPPQNSLTSKGSKTAKK